MLSLHTTVYQQEAFLFRKFYLGGQEVVGKMFVLPRLSFYYLPIASAVWQQFHFSSSATGHFFCEISVVKASCICTKPCVAVGQLITGLVLSPGKCCPCVTLLRHHITAVLQWFTAWSGFCIKNRVCFPVLCPLHVHLPFSLLCFPSVQLGHVPYNSLIQASLVTALFCTGKAFSSGCLGAF